MRTQLSEQEARDAAHEATQNRIVVASAESSAVQQVVANVAFAAAPGMNQQLRATLEKVLPRNAFQSLAIGPAIADVPVLDLAPTLNQQELMVQLSRARTEHWEALSQKQSNTPRISPIVDPELEELRARLSSLNQRKRQQEQDEQKNTALVCLPQAEQKHTGLGCLASESNAEMEAMNAHNRQAIKDLLQQLEKAQLAAKQQQQQEMQKHEAIEAEKQQMIQELKVEAFLANQKQEDLIQELQKIVSAKQLQEDELHQSEGVESETRYLLQEFQGAQQEQEQEKQQQQHEHMEVERCCLLQKLKEAEQEEDQEQQLRAIESEKNMLRSATKQLEEDLMDQHHQSMCETPPSPSSLLDTELNEAQKDALELRTHVQGSPMDTPSGIGETDQVAKHECKRPRVE